MVAPANPEYANLPAESQGKPQALVVCPTRELGLQVATDIELADVWWDAEEYHQKYIDKARGGQGAWSGYM